MPHIFAEVILPRRGRAAGEVLCMAHPRRIARVAKQIEREVGSLLIYDKVLQKAVCPERKRGMDGALSALASVTEVQVTNDLQVAKVYLSIYSDDVGKEAAITGLQRLEGYVRKHIGRTIRLRLTPEIRFIMDESIERTERMFKLLEQVRAIEAGEAPPPPIVILEDIEDEEREAQLAASFGAVDLGMFDDGDESEDKEELEEVSVSGRVFTSDSDGKGSDSGLSNEEVEEMMALFRQESASGGRRTGGGGRGGGRRGGGSGSGGGGRGKKR